MQRSILLSALCALLVGTTGCDGGSNNGTGGNGGSGGSGAQGGAGGEGGEGGGMGGNGGAGGSGGMGGSLEEKVAAQLEAVRNDHAALVEFVRKMPKGADLHSHTSGAVTPESMIAWGAVDGACFDTSTGFASAGPCMGGAVPMSNALNDQALYDSMLMAWSMEGFMGTLLQGHQHFFDAFGKFGAVLIDSRGDDMLAQVRSTAGHNNQVYIELMQGFGSGAVGSIAETKVMPGDGWDEPYLLQKRTEIIADPGFQAAIDSAKASIASAVSGSDVLLNCGTAMADPGCKVDVRFMVAGTRTRSRAYVFGQWVFAFELAQVVPEVVGVNLVSPEEHANSLLYYNDEMLAVHVLRTFNDQDPNRKTVHVGLHAGELIPEVLPMTPAGQAELTYHIRSAVDIAGAERIGHGVDVLGRTAGEGPDELLTTMAQKGVMVEICLTSNDTLLGVAGNKHPFGAYMAKNVPVAPSTDDQGILRIDITDEYVRVVEEHGLDYGALKKLARTSLEHAFIEGKSLWKTRDDFTTRVDECATDVPGMTPSAGCEAFLGANDKARIQWQHESDTAAFEQSIVQP